MLFPAPFWALLLASFVVHFSVSGSVSSNKSFSSLIIDGAHQLVLSPPLGGSIVIHNFTELSETKSMLLNITNVLSGTKSELFETRMELSETNTLLSDATSLLLNTTKELSVTKSELLGTKSQLLDTTNELSWIKTISSDTMALLLNTSSLLSSAMLRLSLLETSTLVRGIVHFF